jgi:phosphoglycolate phosphatase/putative hydrolase of the HAD superfamily
MSAARGVLFDLDGTLYHQPPLRVLMAAELALRPWLQRRPTAVPRLWHALRVFREVREELRSHSPADGSLEERQYSAAASRAGVPVQFMRDAVREWIFERPLPYVHAVRRRDARAVFERLRDDGVSVGVFSDYPVRDKLQALGLDDLVSVQLCATDADVNAFKPHPRGFLVACERWQVGPSDVVYVGDRVEVDASGAAAAGMPCVIIGSKTRGTFVGIQRLSEVPVLVQSSAGAFPSFTREIDAHHTR